MFCAIVRDLGAHLGVHIDFGLSQQTEQVLNYAISAFSMYAAFQIAMPSGNSRCIELIGSSAACKIAPLALSIVGMVGLLDLDW